VCLLGLMADTPDMAACSAGSSGLDPAGPATRLAGLCDARLITTHRDGKAVLHWCTPLGVDSIAAPTTETVNHRGVVAG